MVPAAAVAEQLIAIPASAPRLAHNAAGLVGVLRRYVELAERDGAPLEEQVEYRP